MSIFRRELSSLLLHCGSRLYGLDIFGQLAWIRRVEQWTPEKRAAWRLAKLGDILEFAWKEIPFYKEFWGDHGLSFSRPGELNDLQEYPVLTKKLFKEHGSRICPANLRSIRHIRRHTGGSTSVPVGYNLDLDLWALMEAFHLWGWQQMGYRIGDPVGVIAGGSLVPERAAWKGRLRSFAQRRMFLYGVAMDSDLARDYHRRLRKFGARFLYGYPSILYLFSKHLHELGLHLPDLKAVVTTAEMLLPHYREGIEKFLGCPVFDNYGSNDGGVEAYECSLHAGYHYNDMQSIVEVVPDAAAGAGRIVITNLWNRSTPFIRYENGDLGTSSGRSCKCGAGFPLLEGILGRTTDILTFGCGLSVSGPALTLIFSKMKIDGWQIVQTGSNRVEVRLYSKNEDISEHEIFIRRVLDHHLHGEVDVQVKRVTELTLTKGGKLKPVWVESAA